MTLRDQLIRDEGQILHVYLDSKGFRTAGVGHNLDAHNITLPIGTPISQAQSDQWLDSDILTATNTLYVNLPWTKTLEEARQACLINMTFNLGTKILQFKSAITLAASGDFPNSAVALLDSLWAKQVGIRASRIAIQLATNLWV